MPVALKRCDFSQLETLNRRPEPDTVICVQALHEVTDDIKRSVFARVHDMLAPGRPFYILDRFAYPEGEWMDDWRANWNWMRYRAGGDVLDFDRYHARYRDKTDHVATLENYREWLAEAGFRTVCPYRSFNRALIVARA